MVKGCQRKIIQIKDTGNALFTEAYFVLSEAADDRRETDIVAEATRLVAAEAAEPTARPRGIWQGVFGFLSGVIVCGAAFALFLWLS